MWGPPPAPLQPPAITDQSPTYLLFAYDGTLPSGRCPALRSIASPSTPCCLPITEFALHFLHFVLQFFALDPAQYLLLMWMGSTQACDGLIQVRVECLSSLIDLTPILPTTKAMFRIKLEEIRTYKTISFSSKSQISVRIIWNPKN